MIFIILEMFTSYRQYPSRKAGMTGLAMFMVSYLIWVHIIKYYSDIWVYPVLDVLNLPMRIVFFVIVLIFTTSLYIIGEFANENIWIKEIKQAQKEKAPKKTN